MGPLNRLKTLIIGAGIGGLATAIALRDAGVDVQVFERSNELRESGAGLMIWPNGTRSLQTLGAEVRRLAVDRISFRDWRGLLRDGEPFYLGSTIWRGVVDSDGLALDRGHGVNWVGRGSEFLAFDLPDDRI